MNCPLCKKQLMEISADAEDYGDDVDYICSQRIVAGTRENIPFTLSHFEWRAGANYYLVQVPPYRLEVHENGTNVFKTIAGQYKPIMQLDPVTKKNLSEFGKNYEQLAERIKKLILFS